jgi:hypothetical protein
MVGTAAVYGCISRGCETSTAQETTSDSQTTQKAARLREEDNPSKIRDTQNCSSSNAGYTTPETGGTIKKEDRNPSYIRKHN